MPLDKQTRTRADSALKLLSNQNKGKPVNKDSLLKKLSAQNTPANQKAADSAIRKLSTQNKIAGIKTSDIKKNAADLKNKALTKLGKNNADTFKTAKDTGKLKRDSIYMSADTIETRILTYKDYKVYLEQQRLAHLIDTNAKVKKVVIKESKYLTAISLHIMPDTIMYHRNYFGPPKVKLVVKKPPKPPTKQQLIRDSLFKKKVADSTALAKKLEPSDTARIRIIIAYHHFKMFKSDLQSKSDSMFYNSADSTIRSFVNPIMWTQGSQLSGDTIFLQMKHQKLDNMRMFPNAFIVNIEKTDSVHFNQVGGKRMRGYFKDGKLHRMIIEGNAESIYFSRDSGKMTISGMQRSLSTRITVDMVKGQVTTLGFYTKPENRYASLKKFKEDEQILKGFIWKPKERPVSKESIIPSFAKKAAAKAAADKAKADKTKGTKPPLKTPPGGKETAKDSTKSVIPGKMPNLKSVKDSTKTTAPAKPLPNIKTVKDSTKKPDSLKKPSALKAVRDSVKKGN